MISRLTLSFLLLAALSAQAQKFSTRFRKIDQVARPNFGNLFSVLKDKEGYVWSVTENGLVRHDASNVSLYAGKALHAEGKERPAARIVFEDSLKNLFTITSKGKILQYDRLKDKFNHVNDSSTRLGTSARDVLMVGDRKYWVAHMGEGLAYIDLDNKIIRWYKNDANNPKSLRDNFVTAITYDKRGKLWVATTAGLHCYNEDADNFDYVELNNQNPSDTYRYGVLRSLAYDSLTDQLFVGTYGGLHILGLSDGRHEHVLHNPGNANSLSHNSIFSVIYDKRFNGLWICTYGGGLNFYDLNDRAFQHWSHDPADPMSVGSDNIPGIYLDREGLLWIVTAEAGFYVLSTRAQNFHHIVHHSKNPTSISNGLARAVYAESDSIIWIGFNGTGLNRLNLKTGFATRYVHEPTKAGSIAHNAVIAIDGDKHGRIWVGLEGGGVAIYDPQKNWFDHLQYKSNKTEILNNAISGLLVDDELVWITAYRTPLTVYNMETKKYLHFNADSLWRMGISFHSVRRIRKFEENILFETNYGTVIFDKQKQVFQKLSRGDEQVYVVFVDDGAEAFGSSDKEVQLLLSGNQIYAAEYRPGDSLKTKLLYDGSRHAYQFNDLVMDKNRTLWITTNENLVRYNTINKQERIFDDTQELDISGVKYGMETDRQGRIYIKSNNGLVWFDPMKMNENEDEAVEVKFTSFKIFNHDVPIGFDSTVNRSRLDQHIAYTPKVRIRPSENFFGFGFSALYFEGLKKINYRYRLKGFNDDWVENGTTNFVSFTGLNPGRYTLEVTGTTNPQKWYSKITTIEIEVLPPFWRTWWFITAVVVLVAVSLYGTHQYRVNQKLQVERLRTKIASDLHDEVGSSLTRISIYSDLLNSGVEERQKHDYLKSIQETSREVVGTMSDIVWSIDNRSDKLGDLLLRMKDFASQLLSPRNIEFEFITHFRDDSIILSPRLKQNLYLIFKEALHNIVKHAQAKRVRINIGNNSSGFIMRIKDDGIGLKDSTNTTGNGLRNMQKRAKDIGAQVNMANQNGTVIEVSRGTLV
ncbi:MAG: hypothetical protein KF845_02045 [Cyclobacteriaceae bacterium]|nr:hypothetical protein [Cyclobacteriaceae bacterium]